MKIVAFSDLHGQQNKKLTKWFSDNKGDLLIFAGDLQANMRDDYGYDFMEWFHKLPFPTKLLVFGNHDGYYSNAMFYVRDRGYEDIIFLQDEGINIGGIKIYGSPYTVEFLNWWFMKKDEELAELWKKIPDDTEILITHGPPYGILDDNEDGLFLGSKTLLERVLQLKNLKYHIFGHIHEGFGIKIIDNKTFINVSLLNERYQLTNNPVVINYEGGSIEHDYNVGE